MKNEPVFPETHINCHGLTKLEYFASGKLDAFIANSGAFTDPKNISEQTHIAILYAKELISQLEKN